MMTAESMSALHVLAPPYRGLTPVTGGRRQLRALGRRPGTALVWLVRPTAIHETTGLAERRPGGMSLIMVLPPAGHLPPESALAEAVARARPSGILPHHTPVAEELVRVLSRPPEDLPSEVTDYLAWRGIRLDRDTRHLLRRTVELATELRSISALSRSLYLSRRALGRRLMTRGLPVPSHWLQFSRILHVAIRLQNSEASVLSVAYGLGYPDGFSVSNQMHRLTGYRPNDARRYMGWEWLVEAWLRTEAEHGGLAPEHWNKAPKSSDGTRQRAARPSRGARRAPDDAGLTR